MDPAVSQTLLLATIVAIGALLRATGALKAGDARALNAVIVYVGLPAFVFRAVRGARIGPDAVAVVAVCWAVLAITGLIVWLVVRVRRPRRTRAASLFLASCFGNTGYMGYPVTAAVLGSSALPLAVFWDVFGTVFALVLVGLPVAARAASGAHRVNVIRELMTFPAVIALAAGLAARPLTLPDPVSAGLDLLANMVTPLIMVSVGLSLAPRAVTRSVADVALVGVIRLGVAPALGFAIGDLVLGGDALRVAALQAGMPTMMLALVVGERFGLDTEFIAAAIFVTTALSALTIPLIQAVAF